MRSRPRTRIAASLAGVALALALGASGAAAQPRTDEDSAARIHHDAARRFYELGDYERAIAEWTTAYELSGLPEMLYNLYTAHERAGDLEEAASQLQRFLASDAEIGNRAALEARLAALRERIAARTSGDEAEELEASEADDGAAAPDESDAIAAADVPAPSGSPSALAIAGWAGVGLGAAGALTLAIFGGLAANEYGSLSDRCGGSCTEQQTSDLSTFNAVADVSLAVALLAGATGIVLLVVDATNGGASTSVSLGPGSLHVGGRF